MKEREKMKEREEREREREREREGGGVTATKRKGRQQTVSTFMCAANDWMKMRIIATSVYPLNGT